MRTMSSLSVVRTYICDLKAAQHRQGEKEDTLSGEAEFIRLEGSFRFSGNGFDY